MLIAPCRGEVRRVRPCIVSRLRAEIAGGYERRGIVETADGQIAILAIDKLEPQRRAAGVAERPAGDGGAVIPFRLPLPMASHLWQILEGDRNAPGRTLAHPAMAEIGVVILDLRRVADPAALTAACDPFRHPMSFPISNSSAKRAGHPAAYQRRGRRRGSVSMAASSKPTNVPRAKFRRRDPGSRPSA